MSFSTFKIQKKTEFSLINIHLTSDKIEEEKEWTQLFEEVKTILMQVEIERNRNINSFKVTELWNLRKQ